MFLVFNMYQNSNEIVIDVLAVNTSKHEHKYSATLKLQ